MSSLRSRLWLSYAALITIALSIVAVVLLIYLIRNPISARQTMERLRAAEKLILSRPEEFLPSTDSVTLQHTAEILDVRLLVFSVSGDLIGDSGSNTEPLTLPAELKLRRVAPPVRDSAGRLWLYTRADLPDGNILLVAAPRPKVAGFSIFTDDLLPLFLQGGVIALLLSLVVAYVLARWVADPLQQMLSAARAQPSAETRPIEPHGPQEVQEVMRAFNSMVARAQASQRSQREFVANVSHELKTPLTSIQGFAQAILDGTADSPEARKQAAQVIYAESGRMHRMVVDLLDLARLDAGIADLKMAAVDVALLLQAVLEKFSPQAKQAGVTLALQMEPVPSIVADGDRLAQVFTNLVENALKFTPRGGEVTLQARRADVFVEVEVRDTGAGISAQAMPHIFERFYQADSSRARESGQGAGLGLAIAREIVSAHNGKINVQSQQGHGTSFLVTLPLA